MREGQPMPRLYRILMGKLEPNPDSWRFQYRMRSALDMTASSSSLWTSGFQTTRSGSSLICLPEMILVYYFVKQFIILATLTKIKTSKLLRRKVDGSLKIGSKRPAGSIAERDQEFTLG